MLPDFFLQNAFLPREFLAFWTENFSDFFSYLMRKSEIFLQKLHRFILVKIEFFESILLPWNGVTFLRLGNERYVLKEINFTYRLFKMSQKFQFTAKCSPFDPIPYQSVGWFQFCTSTFTANNSFHSLWFDWGFRFRVAIAIFWISSDAA